MVDSSALTTAPPLDVFLSTSNRTNSSEARVGLTVLEEYAKHARVLKLTLYVIIFLVSALGNSMVCVIILRRKNMKTVTNYFILNLAIADLALTCICIPFDIPVQEMDYVWPYGAFMCKILYPLQTLALFASIYTLTAVSLTRYWAIVHPLRRQLTISKAKILIVLIWVFSIIPVCPYIIILRYSDNSCDESWENHHTRKIYTAFLFTTQYVLPLIVIATAYISIAGELRKREFVTECLRRQQLEETRKIVRMLVVVTVLFAACMLPNNIMWMWLDFGQADQYFKYFWEVVAFSNILTFANSAANPLCYTMLNENYRKEVKSTLKFCLNRTDKQVGGRLRKGSSLSGFELLKIPRSKSTTTTVSNV
ncbi:QRFP-like peptide receptor [Actinia tenebrosa]|uniref:QRFP-like peptide receptor n=1 Tax=Actinia tenebrosa TaxID=6105 RepID=A0A6P8I2Y2_ACTTE|nr:QRFP-like peptide receptor [Actinia tenebrosa]XP_031562187.1 QRFP-like peptide receptor [Actinia tenebrosa]XP_031562188.1 QRFP-like peptide receptor [Actinia tenebrosa]XP_031562189.1 QRFP-like peptide receptor [Actinia tenebrosa]XP_031562190.1 QRFP-like peptide receptor [Actinia tenebrosa]